MLYNDNLYELVMNRHIHNNATSLLIVSGYLGANPIHDISTNTPLNITIIYGMYPSAGISSRLHQTLINLNAQSNLNILYSTIPVHSKCYIWYNGNTIIDVLTGSANFSSSGLNNPLREILTEVSLDFNTRNNLDIYISNILNSCICCTQGTPSVNSSTSSSEIYSTIPTVDNICSLSLIGKGNIVPQQGAINWFNSGGNVTPGDGYIAIKANYIRNYPNLFPPKTLTPSAPHNGKSQRNNDAIDVIWDDGYTMSCLLEGSQSISGLSGIYPKNFASAPQKNILGLYIRRRMGLPPNHIITNTDLYNYGRTDISLSLMPDGTYYADFSV